MPDYSKGKIYKIWSPRTDDIYIGSTTQDLDVRMIGHKSTNSICSSKIIINLGEERIELIELYPCNSRTELNKREGYFIRSLDCVNRYIAGRTKKEYQADNKEHRLIVKKEWYEANKEQIAAQKKVYRDNNKELISEKKKAYRKANIDSIREKKKAYREANIELIREKDRARNRLRREKNRLKKEEQLAEKN